MRGRFEEEIAPYQVYVLRGGPLGGKEVKVDSGVNRISIPLICGEKSFVNYDRISYSDERGDQFEYTG